jgi:hypothetical protein
MVSFTGDDALNVRFGPMLLKKDFEGVSEQPWT